MNISKFIIAYALHKLNKKFRYQSYIIENEITYLIASITDNFEVKANFPLASAIRVGHRISRN